MYLEDRDASARHTGPLGCVLLEVSVLAFGDIMDDAPTCDSPTILHNESFRRVQGKQLHSPRPIAVNACLSPVQLF